MKKNSPPFAKEFWKIQVSNPWMKTWEDEILSALCMRILKNAGFKPLNENLRKRGILSALCMRVEFQTLFEIRSFLLKTKNSLPLARDFWKLKFLCSLREILKTVNSLPFARDFWKLTFLCPLREILKTLSEN